jgi:putative ABC transport system permease protein
VRGLTGAPVLMRFSLRFAVRRLWANRRVAAGLLVGFVLAVAAASSVPAFTAGALQRMLEAEWKAPGEQRSASVHVAHFEDPLRRTTASQFEAAERLMREEAPDLIGLPVAPLVTYASLELTAITPVDPERVNPDVERWATIAYQTGMAEKVRLIGGRLPAAQATPDGSLEVMVEEALLDKQEIPVGAQLWVPLNRSETAARVKVTVVGAFVRTDPDDPYWFQGPFDQALFLPEQTFRQELLPRDQAVPGQYSWYFGVDSGQIRMTDATRLLGDLYTLEARAAQLLPDTELFGGPMEILTRYLTRAIALQRLLMILVLPPLTVVAYFVVVTAKMMADGQRQETAVLRSRGASLGQVAGLYLTEGVVLAVFALAGGYPAGLLLARAMGAVSGFLQFVDRAQPPVLLPAEFWLYGLATAGLSVIAYLLPALAAARQSIVTFKADSARGALTGSLSRWSLGLFSVALAGYGYYTLSRRTMVVGAGEAAPLMEPLHVLAPALFVFGGALLVVGMVPALVLWLIRLTDRFNSAPFYLALVQLSRAPAAYLPLAVMLCLTAGIGLYSAAAARTLEQNIADRIHYATGADVVLDESWEYSDGGETAAGPTAAPVAAPPWQVHQELPGVARAARVRVQEVIPLVGGRAQRKGSLMAIDPPDFGQVAWFRRDLAERHVFVYLNALAMDEEAVLVSRSFLERNKLKLGDRVGLSMPDSREELSLVIYGAIDYWPTLYQDQADFFIANLDTVEQGLGLLPYQVWLKLEPEARVQPVIDTLAAHSVTVLRAADNRQRLVRERRDPQLNGLLGGLTSGFLITVGITVLGFWLHGALSARARTLQFGVVRAMGLSVRQLFLTVLLEQALVVVAGVCTGTALGTLAARLFVPFLQMGLDLADRTPPFLVVTAAADRVRLYVVLLVMLGAGVAAFMRGIARFGLHEVLKLGEDH